ncbi:MAG: phosphate ABC transporter substrate-binding protein [Deltaproteobacteria bacterium]|jgi:phosphate transport system substrate-binding protein|nr:phosphate ABC transporter substrate-binding protein [Deltaproteobacteria bacterium]
MTKTLNQRFPGKTSGDPLVITSFVLVFSLCFGIIGATDTYAQNNPRLMISGSTTVLPLTQSAGEIYLKTHPNLHLSVSGTGTGEGIKSLLDGNIDMAGASRDLLPAEVQRAQSLNVTLNRHLLALDSLAVIVHPQNPLTDLSLLTLHQIYIGKIHNWSEIGGENRPIIAINRDSSSGTFEMWLHLVLRGEHYRRDAQVQPSSGGVAFAVGGNKNALGYIGVGFLTPKVKVLTVDGVKPEPENVLNHTYPLSRELYLFTRDPIPSEAVEFLTFLETQTGRNLISQEGFIPPPR